MPQESQEVSEYTARVKSKRMGKVVIVVAIVTVVGAFLFLYGTGLIGAITATIGKGASDFSDDISKGSGEVASEISGTKGNEPTVIVENDRTTQIETPLTSKSKQVIPEDEFVLAAGERRIYKFTVSQEYGLPISLKGFLKVENGAGSLVSYRIEIEDRPAYISSGSVGKGILGVGAVQTNIEVDVGTDDYPIPRTYDNDDAVKLFMIITNEGNHNDDQTVAVSLRANYD